MGVFCLPTNEEDVDDLVKTAVCNLKLYEEYHYQHLIEFAISNLEQALDVLKGSGDNKDA